MRGDGEFRWCPDDRAGSLARVVGDGDGRARLNVTGVVRLGNLEGEAVAETGDQEGAEVGVVWKVTSQTGKELTVPSG